MLGHIRDAIRYPGAQCRGGAACRACSNALGGVVHLRGRAGAQQVCAREQPRTERADPALPVRGARDADEQAGLRQHETGGGFGDGGMAPGPIRETRGGGDRCAFRRQRAVSPSNWRRNDCARVRGSSQMSKKARAKTGSGMSAVRRPFV